MSVSRRTGKKIVDVCFKMVLYPKLRRLKGHLFVVCRSPNGNNHFFPTQNAVTTEKNWHPRFQRKKIV